MRLPQVAVEQCDLAGAPQATLALAFPRAKIVDCSTQPARRVLIMVFMAVSQEVVVAGWAVDAVKEASHAPPAFTSRDLPVVLSSTRPIAPRLTGSTASVVARGPGGLVGVSGEMPAPTVWRSSTGTVLIRPPVTLRHPRRSQPPQPAARPQTRSQRACRCVRRLLVRRQLPRRHFVGSPTGSCSRIATSTARACRRSACRPRRRASQRAATRRAARVTPWTPTRWRSRRKPFAC